MKKWYRVRQGSGGGGGGGFEAGDACGDVLDEIVTCAEALWVGRFGGPGKRTSVDVESTTSSVSGGGWQWKKGGKKVVAVVKGG